MNDTKTNATQQAIMAICNQYIFCPVVSNSWFRVKENLTRLKCGFAPWRCVIKIDFGLDFLLFFFKSLSLKLKPTIVAVRIFLTAMRTSLERRPCEHSVCVVEPGLTRPLGFSVASAVAHSTLHTPQTAGRFSSLVANGCRCSALQWQEVSPSITESAQNRYVLRRLPHTSCLTGDKTTWRQSFFSVTEWNSWEDVWGCFFFLHC